MQTTTTYLHYYAIANEKKICTLTSPTYQLKHTQLKSCTNVLYRHLVQKSKVIVANAVSNVHTTIVGLLRNSVKRVSRPQQRTQLHLKTL